LDPVSGPWEERGKINSKGKIQVSGEKDLVDQSLSRRCSGDLKKAGGTLSEGIRKRLGGGGGDLGRSPDREGKGVEREEWFVGRKVIRLSKKAPNISSA